MNNIVSMTKVCKNYKLFNLNDISFDIPGGSIVGFIGENGSGKTTTIKAMLNLINIDSGSIKIFNKDNKKYEKKIKENIGAVLDDSFFPEDLNAKEINIIMKNMYQKWDEKAFFNYLQRFNLESNKKFKDYSTGMKVKLKLITALSHNPNLLILDEPTSGLDPVARDEILEIIQEFIENENNSVFISSHITSDLEHIADYIIFINKGKIILKSQKDNIINNYGIVKCTDKEFNEIDKNDYIKYKKNKYDYELLIENRNKFIKKYKIKTIDKATLDDIMLLYIKGE